MQRSACSYFLRLLRLLLGLSVFTYISLEAPPAMGLPTASRQDRPRVGRLRGLPKSTRPAGAKPLFRNGRHWAVVVGVTRYAQWGTAWKDKDLAFSIADARRFLDTLGLEESHVLFLRDDVAEADRGTLCPTRRNILQAVRTLGRKMEKDDTFWFFFSGHGYLSPIQGSCLVPYLAPHEEVEPGLLSIREVRTLLRDDRICGAGRKVLVLDSCFAGMAENPKPLSAPDSEEGDSALMTLAACGPNEQAFYFMDTGSVFTYYLTRGLSGEASSAQRPIVTYDGLQNYVTRMVKARCQMAGKMQTPVFLPQALPAQPIPALRQSHKIPNSPDPADGEIRAIEPIRPGLLVLLPEVRDLREGGTRTSYVAQTLVRRACLDANLPVLAEEMTEGFQQRLRAAERQAAAVRMRNLSASLLLRGRIETAVEPEPLDAHLMRATATVTAELLDVRGNVLASVAMTCTGQGVTELAALQRALDRIAEAVTETILPAAERRLPPLRYEKEE